MSVLVSDNRSEPVTAPTYTGVMPLTFKRSAALRQRAEKLFPGQVDSPVRAFHAVGGEPPFVQRGEGAYLWDADGNRYIDYFGSWGPVILGHAFPPVVEAIQKAATNSASFGASTAAEADLAEKVIACYPAIEKLRFGQLRHRGHNVGHSPGPRRYRPQDHRQV